jgi:UDP-glucose 4-epimerase
MRSCVIGGGGFIGRYLSDALAASGRDVLVLGRKAGVQFTDKRIQYQAVDAADMTVLRPLLATCDEVIDLAYATVPKTSYSDPMFDLQSNLPRVVALM